MRRPTLPRLWSMNTFAFILWVSLLLCHHHHPALCQEDAPSWSRSSVVDRYLMRAVHAFFYLWYGTPETDGLWRHWDHFILPHWTTSVNERYKDDIKRYHDPDQNDLHSPYYPFRGPYSSRDPQVIKSQLQELRQAGVSVVVLSWWGRPDMASSADSQGVETDGAIPLVLNAAEDLAQEELESSSEEEEEEGGYHRPPLKVAFHLEPYPGRSALSVREDIQYIVANYGQSSAFIPLYYVYDSYHIPAEEWAHILTPGGSNSVRSTELDGVYLGLWLEGDHGASLVEGGFDGFYPYFASMGFSYGSTPSHWHDMVSFGKQNGLLPVLSVGPGYNDEKIRPWNKENTKDREEGAYYDRMFETAIHAQPSAISITSYNEWGEGTQIEPSIPKECTATTSGNETHLPVKPYRYLDYSPHNPFFYMERTLHWATIYRKDLPLVHEEGHIEDAVAMEWTEEF